MWSAKAHRLAPQISLLKTSSDLAGSVRELVAQGALGDGDAVELPLTAAPAAETKARVITSSRSDILDEFRVSPNGRWIVFMAVKNGMQSGGGANAILYAVPVAGGAWIPITDGNEWDDKPRWSADGKLIYFVSSRMDFLNLWAIRFDPEQGRPLGQPFPVSAFENPALTIADLAMNSISLSRSRLVLSMTETSGNMWVLEDVDK